MSGNSRKNPLLSRKFILAIATFVTMLIMAYGGPSLDPEVLLAIILPILAWILGEAAIDYKAVKNKGGG